MASSSNTYNIAAGFCVDFSSARDELNKIAYGKVKEYKVLSGICYADKRRSKQSDDDIRECYDSMRDMTSGRIVEIYESRSSDVIAAKISYCNGEYEFISVVVNDFKRSTWDIKKDIEKRDPRFKVRRAHIPVKLDGYLFYKMNGEDFTRYWSFDKKIEEEEALRREAEQREKQQETENATEGCDVDERIQNWGDHQW